MKTTLKLISLLIVICILFSSCAQGVVGTPDTVTNSTSKNNAIKQPENNTISQPEINDADKFENVGDNNEIPNTDIMETPSVDQNKTEQLSSAHKNPAVPEAGTYNEGVVLVKTDNEINADTLSQLDLVSATALYSGSSWYSMKLKADADTVETVTYLRELGCFDSVDYDYIMNTGADTSSVDVSCNPDYEKEKHHHTHKIPEGWEHAKENGKHPGGSPDVIVAVIDTGVDYNHLDLRNNIWVNPAEIPDNGIDDDGNGYIDDIYGWNCVGDDNDPMDDNGHGTHVAGIIAAENNDIGGVGVAYNCKIMVLKAGNSSGYFNNSDIAEAIQYAYMNGASVINMSFGGSNISIAVEEALENAYNTCVLVAAAGNDGRCNQPGCLSHLDAVPMYPAVLPYVIGVMSCNESGTKVSAFSNYDHIPYNSYEYEVFACGEAIHSTWPNNKYTTLNGTSMAAPTVSAIAALLRSVYPNRETYSTKYLQSQIVNTGTINPFNYLIGKTDGDHSVANVYEALTQFPKPDVNLYDYYVDDSTHISSVNNGNGIIDAGETIRLYISLHNRGGVASNINVTIDTIRHNDPSLTDPYFTFLNPTMLLSDIGTYSVRESGAEKYFEIIVSNDCPNDYLVNLNIRFTYKNGMDSNDDTNYEGETTVALRIYRGVHLPNEITSDMTLRNDKEYIVSMPVFVNPGVTLTIEEGVVINHVGDYKVNRIVVAGTLIATGTSDELIYLSTAVETWGNDAYVQITYADLSKFVQGNELDHCIIRGNTAVDIISNSLLYGTSASANGKKVVNCVITDPDFRYNGSYTYNDYVIEYDRCVFYTGDDREAAIHVDRFIPGTKNAFLNSDASAIPLIHNLNGLIGHFEARDFLSFYAPMYDTSLSIEQNTYSIGEIYWGTTDQNTINSYIFDFYDDPFWAIIDKTSWLATAPDDVWPFVTNVSILNQKGEEVTTISNEEVTFVVEFNRDMDTSMPLSVKFGTIEPYADYVIKGEYINPRTWTGKYTLKSSIENGLQYINISNGRASDDHFMELYEPSGRFVFNIDTTAAMSMNLQAVATENGINLTWFQDDYDTLLGYNIYRSTEKDGNYVRLNPAILLSTDESFLDENAEPGKTYWYTYTVVLTDFTESNPAGKVVATAMDTLAPNMYHTPVNQGYMNNNLVISCTASDNVAISTVTLYYRAIGTAEWKTLNMSKQSDKYSATIFGSDLTLDGIEYYIVASDGRNTINKGSAEAPYTVVVKDASSISRMGDVDGDGVVTAKDALMLMRCLEGSLLLSDDEFKRADLNSDGVLSAAEALRILQYVNGKVNTLEM